MKNNPVRVAMIRGFFTTVFNRLKKLNLDSELVAKERVTTAIVLLMGTQMAMSKERRANPSLPKRG